jgi:putative oxidoreductase
MSFLARLSIFEFIGLLALRAGSGLFLASFHGWGKVTALWAHLIHGEVWGFPNTVASLGFPIPLFFAALSTITEFIGGLLFAAGLYTRYVALFILINMSVAVYRHVVTDMRYELAALFLLISLYILIKGAGRYSLDRFLNFDRF